MDIQKSFEVLGIFVTKEEPKIRDAYRKLLIRVNPEDDPEGFKELREAYETAVSYARTPDEEVMQETSWMEQGAAGDFLRRLADIYGSLPRRLDLEEWRALTDDPVLDSLDDAETAKWGLFSYLAEHYRVPCRVWKLLDKTFFIEENQQEFKEHLPENFIDYMLYKLHDQSEASDFPFAYFRGAPEADYDGFMELFSTYMNQRDLESEQGRKEADGLLSKMEGMKIYHPWLSLERILWLYHMGEAEEAKSQIRKLLQEYKDNERICLGGAGILYDCGQTEEARELYEAYLKRDDRQEYGVYQSLYRLGCLEADRENWEQARKYLWEAGGCRNTDEVRTLLTDVCGKLIEDYKRRTSPLAKEEGQELLWIYYEAGRVAEGADLLDAHPEYLEDTAGCHKIQAYIYRAVERLDECLRELKAWRRCLEAEPEFDAEEKEQRHQLAMTFFREGEVLNILYEKAARDQDVQSEAMTRLYEDVLKVHDRAVELEPEDVDYQMERMTLLRLKGEWRKAADACEEILKREPGYFWACFYLQEAYAKLRMGQQVVDTFYRAKKIYSGNPTIYERAVEVFDAYHQYEDALGIIRQAEEAGVAGDHSLLRWKVRLLCHRVENDETYRETARQSEEIRERLMKEQADADILQDVCMELAYLYEEGSQNVEKGDPEGGKRQNLSFERAEQALELQDSLRTRYFLGRFWLKYRNNAKKAYEHLKLCEERGMDFEWMYFYLARCKEQFEEWNEAIAYYKKAVEQNPENEDCYWRIGWLYRRKFARTEQRFYAEQALFYINLQEEKFGAHNQEHRWRGYIYVRMKEYDKALYEIEEGLKNKNDQDCGMWFLKGQILRFMKRYEEAIVCYENSIRAEDRYGEDDENCWRNIFMCFLRIRQYDRGCRYFEKALKGKLSKTCRDQCLENLADLCAEAGYYDRALYWQAKRYGGTAFDKRTCDTWEKEAARVEDVLNVWQRFQLRSTEELLQHIRNAAVLADRAFADGRSPAKERALMCQNVGERFYYAGDYEQALRYLKKAEKLADGVKSYGQRRELLCLLMQTSYWLGHMDQAEKYGCKYREDLEKTYLECSDLELPMEELMTKDTSSNSLYRLFCWAYFTGRTEQAAEYGRMMEERGMCYWCDDDGCTELWEIRGYVAFAGGDIEKSLECFKIAGDLCWLGGNMDTLMMRRRLQFTPHVDGAE